MTESKPAATPDDARRPGPPRLFAWLASVTTVASIVAAQFLPREQLSAPYLGGSGVFLLLLAGVSIFWPFYLLAKHGQKRERKTYMQASRIVDCGVYAITRHPQYLGYIGIHDHSHPFVVRGRLLW